MPLPEAQSAASAVGLRNQLTAEEIAAGHAFKSQSKRKEMLHVLPGSASEASLQQQLVIAGYTSGNVQFAGLASLAQRALDASRLRNEVAEYGAPLPTMRAFIHGYDDRQQLQAQELEGIASSPLFALGDGLSRLGGHDIDSRILAGQTMQGTGAVLAIGAMGYGIRGGNLSGGVEEVPNNAGATFGRAVSNNYRATFLAASPELEGQVVVHHAVEQGVLTKFPGVVSEAEMHSLENLRGIPNEINSDIHLSQIRVEWNRFYKPFIESGTSPTQEQLLQKATEIDNKFGSQFTPPVR